ncbi:hypothetical protein N0V88_007674 [Collariella sp. IMI 366227]|nr:hypothetical protein N0V88_007674 [Collariella sp. IMI 366227]
MIRLPTRLWAPSPSLLAKRNFSATAKLAADHPAVNEINGPVDVDTFRRIATAGPERPIVLRSRAVADFRSSDQDATPAPSQGSHDTQFIRFDAPLAFLCAALEFNRQQSSPAGRLSQLYIAQALLSDLPHELQGDVPTPLLLTAPPTQDLPYSADVYGSSVWIGLESTYTPFHRDPNPNLFCQLYGSKVIRLMPPRSGERFFRKVMTGLGEFRGSAAIRGEEMMQGAERQAWLDAVWGSDPPAGMLEVVLHPRDVLFFHKGWWHSVKSMGESGDLNASVNWWFRWRKHNH